MTPPDLPRLIERLRRSDNDWKNPEQTLLNEAADALESLQPVWTNDVPQVAGFYWCRLGADCPAQTVQFFIINYSDVKGVLCTGTGRKPQEYGTGCQWSGPIQPPGEKP